jgi:hypothetical protein
VIVTSTAGCCKPAINITASDTSRLISERARGVPRHCSGTAAESQALGSMTASVRLTGAPSGTLPVRMRHAQPVLAFTSAARDRQQSCVGAEPPPLVLLVRKLRQGVKLVISDAVHDAAPPCPDAGAASDATTAAAASSLMARLRFSPIDRSSDELVASRRLSPPS